MTDWVLPDWAKEVLIGRTVESVGETFPHTLMIKFTDGTSLVATAMPFNHGTLDVSVIEGTETFIASSEAARKKP